MSYFRVVPRDLFNESKLLKCVAQLWLQCEKDERTDGLQFNCDGSPFGVKQDPSSGAIYISNIPVYFNGYPLYLYTGLNARGSYPMYCDFRDDTVPVFEDSGGLHDDFIKLLAKMRELSASRQQRRTTP